MIGCSSKIHPGFPGATFCNNWQPMGQLSFTVYDGVNSEEVINDIIREFEYLETFGFKRSTWTDFKGGVSTAFLGEEYNITLMFEYIAENFDFVLIDAKTPRHCQFWKLIERYSPDGFDYEDIKPRYGEPYKPKLHNLATKFEKIIPIILRKEKSELFAK